MKLLRSWSAVDYLRLVTSAATFDASIMWLASMKHWQRVGLTDQLRIEIEIKIQTALSLGLINAPGHEQVGGIMVAFRFYQPLVKCCELRIDAPQF